MEVLEVVGADGDEDEVGVNERVGADETECPYRGATTFMRRSPEPTAP